KNSRSNELFCGFTPAISATALKAMRTTIRDLKLRSRTDVSLADIARKINPLLRGWIAYYGRYMPSACSRSAAERVESLVSQESAKWATLQESAGQKQPASDDYKRGG